MSNKLKTQKIICPKCGTQYLPAEIYLPNSFLGKPKNIVKDFAGKIIDYDYNSMDLKETYTCDKCNTTFSIRATVQFFTDIKENVNIKQPFKLSLNKNNKLIMAEE